MAQEPPTSNIPPFRPDGYLPEGVYVCSEAEVIFRFGSSGRRRRRLVLRLRRWIELGRQVGARRLLVDGSFVTAKEEPDDIDTVIRLPEDFTEQLEREYDPALELEERLLTRLPEEIFAAEDETDWEEWVDFFSRTREPDGRRRPDTGCLCPPRRAPPGCGTCGDGMLPSVEPLCHRSHPGALLPARLVSVTARRRLIEEYTARPIRG
jgi:hypothetical protein